MRGVEPADSGVAHQRVAATLHLHGGLRRDRLSWIAVDAGARSTTRTWVEWESNPRFDGVRIRCKPAFATDPFPSVVPPSGIEPEPRGLQPRAQTTCARVGNRPACVLSARTRVCLHRVPARAPIIVITVQLSEITRRAQGAPRAVMRSPKARAHPSRTHDLDSRSGIRKTRLCVALDGSITRPETTTGRLVSLGGPFSVRRLSRQSLEGLPEEARTAGIVAK